MTWFFKEGTFSYTEDYMGFSKNVFINKMEFEFKRIEPNSGDFSKKFNLTPNRYSDEDYYVNFYITYVSGKRERIEIKYRGGSETPDTYNFYICLDTFFEENLHMKYA